MRSEESFPAAVAAERCWDAEVQAVFEERGEPLVDCVLQNREELIALFEFMREQQVHSYLEIGIWTGRLLALVDRLFHPQPLAACDDGWASRLGLPVGVPPHARVFWGSSRSDEFRRWREQLGPVDLVLIDGDHSYHGVRHDFEVNRAQPHRFLCFHDITGGTRQTAGVGRFWRELHDGHKLELIRPHPELGLERSRMGLGIWSERPFG